MVRLCCLSVCSSCGRFSPAVGLSSSYREPSIGLRDLSCFAVFPSAICQRGSFPPSLRVHEPRTHAIHGAHTSHVFHHARHPLELLEQFVDFGRIGPAAVGDAVAAGTVDLVRISAVRPRHRLDHRPDAVDVLVRVHVSHAVHHGRQLAHAGDHLHDRPHRAELLDLLHRLEEVVQRELPLHHPLLLALHFVLIEPLRLFRPAWRRPPCPRIRWAMRSGWNGCKLVELFADADELDRHAGDRLDRQGRPAAGVAVELGEDHAVEFQRVVERLGAS